MAELSFEVMLALGAAIGSEQGQVLAADGDRLMETYGAKGDPLVVEEDSSARHEPRRASRVMAIQVNARVSW